VILNDCEYVGDVDNFAHWALIKFSYMDNSHSIIYDKVANDTMRRLINNNKARKYASMGLSFGGVEQTVVFELFHDIAPRTVDNFLALCETHTRSDGQLLSYVNSEVHRVVKGMFIQCGRIEVEKNSEMGTSIHGSAFEDESFHVKHTEIGLLGMCKRQGLKHTNESQFYVTTGAPLTFLDNKNVVFGRVIQGMRAFKLIEKLETTNERPNECVKIVKAGKFTK
jgi:cyclophilin family peptidyl-prolyl cis-trans isomerase